MIEEDKAAARRRLRMTPVDRRRQLIVAARGIFIGEGYAAVSLRAVAAACDVRLSTVQHHFDGRHALIDALIDALIAECMTVYGRHREEPGLTPEARLRATIDIMMTQNEDEETALLFPELWAFAEREPVAAAGVDRLYRHARGLLAEMISALHPRAPAEALDHSARLVMALADGLLVSSGTRCGRSRSTVEERGAFIEAAMRLARRDLTGRRGNPDA